MLEEKIKNLLKKNHLSITNSRIAIIKCLMDDHLFHSVKDISLHSKNLNTKSIYNNIKALVKANLIEAYSFSGTTKYAMIDDHQANEIHIIGSDDVVHHHQIDPKIYQMIEQNIKIQNHTVNKIRIFVEIK